MIPKLNRKDAQDRITAAIESSKGAEYLKAIRKKKTSGSTSAEIRMKQKLGKQMKSNIEPVDTVKAAAEQERKI